MKFGLRFFISTLLVVGWAVSAQAQTQTQTHVQAKVIPANKSQIQLSFAPLVKKTAPAVVNVFTSKIVRTRQMTPLFNDPFFQRFFGGQLQQRGRSKRRVQNALGSGVLIDGQGIIVTNNHVIEGADEIKVVLSDRREFEAKLLGRDARTDLAVLKIETRGETLPFLRLSDSDGVETGDLVLAIGNPFGVGQTVTSGIVSALARTNIGVSNLNSFIQTDAAINPGNSGGALVNMQGQLLGINTAIFTKSGGSQGIGFAIPANMVSHVVKSLLSSGDVVRPWLGASGQNVTSSIAQTLGLKRPVGIMVTSVFDKGPAERAGIKVGDVLLSINGHELLNIQDLRFRIATQSVGDVAQISVMRRNGTVNLTMPLEAPPEIPKRNETLIKGKTPLSGAVVANLSPALTDKLGLPYALRGVMVLKLGNNGNAVRLGIKPGDMIRKINGTKVATVKQLVKILQDPRQGWLIALERGGRNIKLVVR